MDDVQLQINPRGDCAVCSTHRVIGRKSRIFRRLAEIWARMSVNFGLNRFKFGKNKEESINQC